MKRTELSTFWMNKVWLLRLTAILFILLSPIVIPIIVLYENKKDFKVVWDGIIEGLEKIEDDDNT